MANPWVRLFYVKILFMLKRYIYSFCLLLIAQTSVAIVHVTDIRVSHASNKTRIVFNLSGVAKYHHFVLSKPDRLVIDLNNTQLKTKLDKVDLSKTLIEGIRGGKTSQHVLRVVLDLRAAYKNKIFELTPKHGYGYRLVIDLNGKPPEAVKSAILSPVISASQHKHPNYLMVVIDPGHGGKDPGATGRRGTHEKNIVLSIAKDLRADLLHVPGIKVCMTRNADYFVTLRGRLAIARKCHGDIFVAIHADAYRNSRANGVSVFALSQRGATSESARWLAARENNSEMLGGNIDLSDKSHLLSSVLIDLSQTATINSSIQLGKNVIKRMSYVARMHSHKVDQAAFVVLKSPDIPSILIETGFLSNYAEEAKLRTASYRAKIASAVSKAITDYFNVKAPGNTLFKKSESAKTYKVKQGDNLSLIAFKYGTSVVELKKLNKLNSSNLRIGQILKIPS
jgi:N-acetylmuramoyl-L-alanine amidase